ncbi:aspartic proteinase CDR1-like [Primulina eburnea]|uniref:aspartic proteinase CDR1-like n=1 Tax=Primulina eburnea TaxID=1245227 RepID=UPI003C6C2749
MAGIHGIAILETLSIGTNQLSLGSGAILQGHSTPTRLQDDGFHFATIEGISLGQKKLEIDEDEFEFSVLFDSGSSISHLKESGYESIVEEVDNLMAGFLDPAYIGDGEQCYKGNMDRELDGFPLLTFHFSEGADFEVGVEGMFLPFNKSIFCLAIHRSES